MCPLRQKPSASCRERKPLSESNLRLHKFASNSEVVLQAFAPEDRAGLHQCNTVWDCCGRQWQTLSHSQSQSKEKPSLAGEFCLVNSIFDPLGMASVTIEGKRLLWEISVDTCNWDAPLPEQKLKQLEAWRESPHDLSKLHIPRAYTAMSLSSAVHTELCVFSDASTKARGVVAYLRTIQPEGKV